MKYGKLTLIEEAPRRGKYCRMGKFRCECGVEKAIALHPVMRGGVKSCGCAQREFARNQRFVDISGEVHGRWTCLGQDAAHEGLGRKWVVQCECGVVKSMTASALRKSKSCGCLTSDRAKERAKMYVGEMASRWRGGKFVTRGGYVMQMAKHHPRASSAGYVFEHILVMEDKIGRTLIDGESVHHINGVRHDNRPENLELWDRSHPPGQRHIEKMAFYVSEILAKASDDELLVIERSIKQRIQQRADKP